MALVIYGMPVWAVLLAMQVYANTAGDKHHYRQLQREIAAWDARVATDSTALDALDQAVSDSASAAVDRMTVQSVREQHAKYGHVIFTPESLVTPRAETRDS